LSSINSFPTFNYSQPEEYRFSHDSVFLARRVFEYLEKNKLSPHAAIDICSGCGIIGLDLLFHVRTAGIVGPRIFDFLDVQLAYQNHFQENVSRLGPVPTSIRFVNGNYSDTTNSKLSTTYDLMVCNPPYFSQQQGKLPPNDLKLRSRFFVDSDLASLIEFVYRKLSADGSAFVLIRNQLEHNQDQLAEVIKLCREKLNVTQLEDIRGTHVVQLRSLLTR